MSAEPKRQAILNEIRSDRFAQLMREGGTTRLEEQGFILECQKAWAAFRASLGVPKYSAEEPVRKKARKGA